MKFSFKKMLAGGLLAGVMTFCSAGAASFDSAAQSLNDLGLLTGTQTGFDLDRASTRGEAAAMLVRLLGKDAEANTLWETDAGSFAFTDMEDSAWAKPSVNWLVKNSLAAGTTETTFAPREECSAQMAATFLLRALGYSDAEGGDFTYFTAMDFAREKGVIDLVNCEEANFQRDHLVAMCYTALSLSPKTGEADLLSKLVADGAIADNEASQALRQKFADYREYAAVSAGLAKMDAYAFQVHADIRMTADGEPIQMTMEQEAAIKMDLENLDSLEMSMTGAVTLTAEGETVSIPNTMYYKDGVSYVDVEETKMKVPMDARSALDQSNLMDLQGVSGEPITAIDSLTKSADGDKTVFDIVYNAKLLGNAVDRIMGGMVETLPDLSDEQVSVSVDKLTVHEVVANNALEQIDFDMALKFGDNQSNVDMQMNMTMLLTATGDAVTIEAPESLDDYVDVDSLTTAPAPQPVDPETR